MTPTRLGRPSERQDFIVQELRGQIVRGDMSPGERLPTRDELGAAFGVSSMTIQRALDRLKGDGFVQVNGRNGTRVSPAPPHLNRYAIVFPQLPEEPGWTGYYTALTRSAERTERAGKCRLPLYHHWETEHAQSGYLSYDDLYNDIKSELLAGVITTGWPLHRELQAILDDSTLPRVVLGHDDDPNISCVSFDHDSFWTKAFEHLHQRGCRRIACISTFIPESWRDKFEAQVANYDMITRPYWWHVAHAHAPQAAHQIAHLMLHSGQHERPDALIVADDNFVEAATTGLLAAGRSVPGDLEVVAHCNFPYPTPAFVPVRRLGYDARAVIEASVQGIEAQRRGEAPSNTLLSAIFESELAPDTGLDSTTERVWSNSTVLQRGQALQLSR